MAFRNDFNERRRQARGLPPLARRWICPECFKARRTNFCQDCGCGAPPPPDVQHKEAYLATMRCMVSNLGTNYSSFYNASMTWFQKGEVGQADGFLKKANEFKPALDALTWALSELEGRE